MSGGRSRTDSNFVVTLIERIIDERDFGGFESANDILEDVGRITLELISATYEDL